MYYENPRLITRATSSEGLVLHSYMGLEGAREDLEVVLEHRYLVDCPTVKSLSGFYYFFTLFYLAAGALWIHQVWYKYEHESLHVQKLLIGPIFLKIFQVFIFALYVGQCPWKDQIQARYQSMALVTIATIYQTILTACLLLISKGWSITRLTLPKNDLSSITLLMGAVYLTYSAYYVSENVRSMRFFVSFFLNLLYLCLLYTCLKSVIEVRQMLRL